MSLLEVDHITQHFGGLCAVSDFSLRLEPGELVGLIGPNGAGKTTVFNVMTGVYRPSTGRIRLEGEDLVGLSPSAIHARGLARTFQNIRLFKKMTVLDNVRLARYARLGYNPLEAPVNGRRIYRTGCSASWKSSGRWLRNPGSCCLMNPPPA